MAKKDTNKATIAPLADRVLIKVAEGESGETKSAGGIIIPVASEEKQADRGTVVAVGEGRTDSNGKLVPMKVKVGDKVVFQWGDKMTVDGEEYYIVSESSVLAIIN